MKPPSAADCRFGLPRRHVLSGVVGAGMAIPNIGRAQGNIVQTGLDVIALRLPAFLRGKNVGLLTHGAAVAANGASSVDVCHQIFGPRLRRLFGPEHGLAGRVQAGEHVGDDIDGATGLHIVSLYGQKRAPSADDLADLDVLLVDLQDIGARFYTYAQTMFRTMDALSASGKMLVVLDRPNPLGGQMVAGPILRPAFASMVGQAGLPIAHGMTLGELAHWYKDHACLNVDVHIVAMVCWARHMGWAQTGRTWVNPSPNMGGPETALAYIGMALFEGTNISEGRGTVAPFFNIGAPFIDGVKLAQRLNQLGLSGARFAPATFTPTMSKYMGENCQGVRLEITNRRLFRPLKTALNMLGVMVHEYVNDFSFLNGHPPFFDLLLGAPDVRAAILDGRDLPPYFAQWAQESANFNHARQTYLIYQ